MKPYHSLLAEQVAAATLVYSHIAGVPYIVTNDEMMGGHVLMNCSLIVVGKQNLVHYYRTTVYQDHQGITRMKSITRS